MLEYRIMDPSKIKSLPGSARALPVLDPRSNAILKVIEQSKFSTTQEQLAAYAYAWGSKNQEVPRAYRQNFEQNKKTFLSACGSADSKESLTVFNYAVRAGILGHQAAFVEQWQRIFGAGLWIRADPEGHHVSQFLLHIHPDGTARLRYG